MNWAGAAKNQSKFGKWKTFRSLIFCSKSFLHKNISRRYFVIQGCLVIKIKR